MTTLKNSLLRGAVAAALALPLAAAAQMTPGMFEYSFKFSMPGGPGIMPTQTSQRCLGAKDLEGNKAYQMPQGPGSDCQIKDLKDSGGKFSCRWPARNRKSSMATCRARLRRPA